MNLESTVFDRNSDINVPENKCPEGISHSEQESFQSASDPKSKATSTNVTTTGHSKVLGTTNLGVARESLSIVAILTLGQRFPVIKNCDQACSY